MKSFLTPEERELFRSKLVPPPTPDGDEDAPNLGGRVFSKLIIQKVEEKFSAHPLWLKTEPIALGSWARGELCACSDLDLLFLGEEEIVASFVSDFQKQGMKIRSRLPQNKDDWSEGVEAFDVIALLDAKPFTENARLKLQRQTELIESRGKSYRRELLKSMGKERKSRNERYDSIANFLEPNLKFGPGGLRDLHQALNLANIFQEKLKDSPKHQLVVLNYYLEFWLLLRHKLHLDGGGDILSANDQLMISKWLGYKNIQEFMREVQKGISRVNFYSDLLFAEVESSPLALKKVRSVKLSKPIDCVRALQKDQSTLMQSRIRYEASAIFRGAKQPALNAANKEFLSLIHAKTPDAITHAVFRSTLIDVFVPDFKKIVGHVQHDQYHRFSVDAHLLQALRELKRVYLKPKIVGALSTVAKSLKPKDWEILSWTCLLHDLAKGRGGDHSQKGVELAKLYLKKFKAAQAIQDEVLWMIDKHLIISDAAFRKNPSANSTLRELFDQGVQGARTSRLTIFTAVDIRATNPDAWNAWKEKLLKQLVLALEAPEASAYLELEKSLGRIQSPEIQAFLEGLDPFLLTSVPTQVLAADLKRLFSQKKSLELSPAIYQSPKKEIWIRFYEGEDRKGVFLNFAQRLFSLKCSINHASITSHPNYGVYDWFQVRTNLTKEELSDRILKSQPQASDLSKVRTQLEKVRFDKVEMVSQSEDDVVVAFTGRDQAGLLLKAAQALSEQGLNIRWAKVHTWGRQIQDLFAVDLPREKSLEDVIQNLKADVT